MTKLIDRFINLLKWPLALYMTICLPALLASVDYYSWKQYRFLALGAGFFMYFVGRTMMDSSVKTSMQIIAHELTHSFFALITLHKVNHIHLDPEGSSGEMGFSGEGNWLIVIAPYFFPLFGMFYMIVMGFFPPNYILHGILGYFLGYHTDTVASQIHEKQTDLPKVGYTFCLFFLPGANLWVIGSILAFNSHGWSALPRYFELINHLTANNIRYLLNLLF